jgi:hypothetical protein
MFASMSCADAMIHRRAGEHRLPRLRVESVDATGAGDTFLASPVAVRGWSLRQRNGAGCHIYGVDASLPRYDAFLAFLGRQARPKQCSRAALWSVQ